MVAHQEEDKLKYGTTSFRISEETRANLKKYRAKSEKSWNLFFVELIKLYEAKQKSNGKGSGRELP